MREDLYKSKYKNIIGTDVAVHQTSITCVSGIFFKIIWWINKLISILLMHSIYRYNWRSHSHKKTDHSTSSSSLPWPCAAICAASHLLVTGCYRRISELDLSRRSVSVTARTRKWSCPTNGERRRSFGQGNSKAPLTYPNWCMRGKSKKVTVWIYFTIFAKKNLYSFEISLTIDVKMDKNWL